jgi:hypothetical protein
MALPFEKEKNIRKFQCFVCGHQFLEFQEYTDHIIEKHEEGREYVRCPLSRCRVPVRDTRSHFKAFHRNEKIPTNGSCMMRAIEWKDIKPADGSKTKKKPKFREGNYESTKMGKTFHYDSGWECTVLECLDAWNEVLAFEVEPFEIPYIHDGKCHKYLPDLFIAFLDGHKEVWEVKPSNQTALKKNQDKWFSAKAACEARGWGFEVVTEQLIEKLKKKVKTQHLIVEEEEPDYE